MIYKNSKEIKVLDCTLRDGGYYNHWNFSHELVEHYLSVMSENKINAIEIGFRFIAKEGFLGAYAYTTDDFLNTLDIPKNIIIGVMINAADVINHPSGSVACINELFIDADKSPVKLVRFAAHFKHVHQCREAAERLKSLGYMIGFNLMQAINYSNDELHQIADTLNSWGCIDVLYFADSLGNMKREDIYRIYTQFSLGWKGEIGIHAHNNMGRALENSLNALSLGASWVDATVLGMGRGAGNTQLEHMLIELEQISGNEIKLPPLFRLIQDYFVPLMKQYHWGENMFYYMAGVYAVHPTYVQQMISEERYSSSDIINVLKTLDENVAKSYSLNSLDVAIQTDYNNVQGDWSPVDWLKDKSVLIIAGGSQARNHLEGIYSYINRNNPTVLSINYLDFISEDIVSAFVACHPTRIRAQAAIFKKLKKTLIAPWNALQKDEQTLLSDIPVLNYGMSVEKNYLEAGDKNCTVPYPVAMAYALCVIGMSGAKKVILCGFDGYNSEDHRQIENNHIFDLFEQQFPDIELIAATPTLYHIKQKSIYMPTL